MVDRSCADWSIRTACLTVQREPGSKRAVMRLRVQRPRRLFAELADVPRGAADTPTVKPLVSVRKRDGYRLHRHPKTGKIISPTCIVTVLTSRS